MAVWSYKQAEVIAGFAFVQMKKPVMVTTNLTLANEEGADKEVKLTTMLFNLGKPDKAANFISVVDEIKPK